MKELAIIAATVGLSLIIACGIERRDRMAQLELQGKRLEADLLAFDKWQAYKKSQWGENHP